jgi:copper transport protein
LTDTSRPAKALTVLLMVCAALVLSAHPARAHAELLETTPHDGAVLAASPGRATLRFNEGVTPTPRSVLMLDWTGRRIPIGAPTARDDTVTARLPANLAKGTYVVSWRVISADSHPASGAFRFSVGQPTAGGVRTDHATGTSVKPIVHGIGRILAFLGMAIALGGAVFVGTLWRTGRAHERARRVVWAGIAALAVGTVVVFVAQGPETTGEPMSTAFDAGVLRLTASTWFGQALLIRLAAAAGLAAAFAAYVRRPGPWVLAAGAGCGLVLTLTWTLADHSHTGPQPWLAVPASTAHLLAMALWLGGLAMVVACVSAPAADGGALALSRFSALAQVCFVTLIATGGYLAWRQVRALGALGGTDYGRLLLVKLAVVLAVLAFAEQSRRLVRRHGHGAALRRSVAVETVLGCCVIAVTAVLGNVSPARDSYAPPAKVRIAMPAASGAPLRGGHVEVSVVPARPGANVADIYLVAKDRRLVQISELTARLVPANESIGALPVRVNAAEPGHYVANPLSIPYPGSWLLQLELRTSEIDETAVRVPFTAH